MRTGLLNSCTRAASVLALLLLVLFGVPQTARADWIIRGETIPAGQVVDNDVIITGTNVIVDGTVNGDVFAVGTSVTINGPVRGSILAVGRTVSLNGDVGGSVYVAAQTLKLGSSSYVHNNVHSVVVLLDSQRGSKIGRDLVAASVRATIASEIGRSFSAIIALLTFDGKIGYGLDQDLPQPESDTAPSSKLEDGSVLLFIGTHTHKIAGQAAPMLMPPIQTEDIGGVLPQWVVARLGEFAALVLVGGLSLWGLPTLSRRCVQRLRAKPLPATGYGLLAAIIFVNGLGIALLLAAMLVAVGLWLGSVTLWQLAFLFWGVGFSLLILAASLAALAVFYGSKVVVSYLIASLILERLAPKTTRYRIVVLLLGLVLYVLLRSIPTIGWVIEIVVVVLGLGAIWLAFLKEKQAIDQTLAEPILAEPEASS